MKGVNQSGTRSWDVIGLPAEIEFLSVLPRKIDELRTGVYVTGNILPDKSLLDKHVPAV